MSDEARGRKQTAFLRLQNGIFLQSCLTLRRGQDIKKIRHIHIFITNFWNYTNFKIIHYYFHQLSTYKNFIKHHLSAQDTNIVSFVSSGYKHCILYSFHLIGIQECSGHDWQVTSNRGNPKTVRVESWNRAPGGLVHIQHNIKKNYNLNYISAAIQFF